MKILITGGLGKTAEPLISLLLQNHYAITVLDISKENPLSLNGRVQIIQGDICDSETVKKATENIDVIIHLAVNVTNPKNAALSFQTNVFGTYNLLFHAIQNHVKKVLVASSAPVHMSKNLLALKQSNPNADYFCSPDNDFTYDLTKNIQELIVQNFSRTYHMDSLVLRLGHIVDGKAQTDLNGSPLSELMYCRGGWVCRYDVARAFLKGIEADFCGFHLFHIIGSYQASECFDLTLPKEIIGFECREHFVNY